MLPLPLVPCSKKIIKMPIQLIGRAAMLGVGLAAMLCSVAVA
jgi:hypothetical protein